MSYPKPNRYVVTAVDANGQSIPAAYRSNCRWRGESNEEFSSLHFAEGIRVFARTQSEEGYEVTVEGLPEIPDELFPGWVLLRLLEFMPPDRRKDLEELGVLALERAEGLRNQMITERTGERLFVALAPGDDEVLGLVFTRGEPLVFQRMRKDWVRCSGFGDYEFKMLQMVAVSDDVLPLYDERMAGGEVVLYSELRERGMLKK